jgi:manganese transport protein
LAWGTATIIIALNARLVVNKLVNWLEEAADYSTILWLTVVPVVGAIFFILVYISLPKSWRRRGPMMAPQMEQLDVTPQRFQQIGVALDLGTLDAKVLSLARSMAQQNQAKLILLHVVEGVGGQLFGKDAYDDEARDDLEHLDRHAEQLRAIGIEVEAVLGFGNIPKEIVRLATEKKFDLLMMGGHGHSGWKDILFGTSVSKVRHHLKIPVMVVQ